MINMPGTSASDIDVPIDDQRVLTVEATTRYSDEQKDQGKVLRRESCVGRFRRRLTLPEEVDPSTLHSDYKDGVLTFGVRKQSAVS
jgi:HSP20 family molecular chaperone IbpA